MAGIKRLLTWIAAMVFSFVLVSCMPQLNAEGYDMLKRREKINFQLPSSLQIIEEEAFRGISAESVFIQDGLTEIRSESFADANSLIEIYLPESIVNIAENAFGTNNKLTIWGARNSAAEDWAQKHGIPFQIMYHNYEVIIPYSMMRLLLLLLILLLALCIQRGIQASLLLRIPRNAQVVDYRSMREQKRGEVIELDLCFP